MEHEQTPIQAHKEPFLIVLDLTQTLDVNKSSVIPEWLGRPPLHPQNLQTSQ